VLLSLVFRRHLQQRLQCRYRCVCACARPNVSLYAFNMSRMCPYMHLVCPKCVLMSTAVYVRARARLCLCVCTCTTCSLSRRCVCACARASVSTRMHMHHMQPFAHTKHMLTQIPLAVSGLFARARERLPPPPPHMHTHTHAHTHTRTHQ
jgi:hypothetical protein